MKLRWLLLRKRMKLVQFPLLFSFSVSSFDCFSSFQQFPRYRLVKTSIWITLIWLWMRFSSTVLVSIFRKNVHFIVPTPNVILFVKRCFLNRCVWSLRRYFYVSLSSSKESGTQKGERCESSFSLPPTPTQKKGMKKLVFSFVLLVLTNKNLSLKNCVVSSTSPPFYP